MSNELDELEFDEGDFGEGYPWYIRVNHEIELRFHEPCRHCRQPTPEEKEAYRIHVSSQTIGDGKESFVICPWTVNSVNEGGHNRTSVCLQCIIEAGFDLQLKDKLKGLLDALRDLLSWAYSASREIDARASPEALRRADAVLDKSAKGVVRQELVDTLRSLIDWAAKAAEHLKLAPQCLQNAVELLAVEDNCEKENKHEGA